MLLMTAGHRSNLNVPPKGHWLTRPEGPMDWSTTWRGGAIDSAEKGDSSVRLVVVFRTKL